jgi:hypothetical protein
LNSNEKYRYLSTFISKDVYELIRDYNDVRNKAEEKYLLRQLVVAIELLHEPLNNNDTDNLILTLAYIRTELCKRHSFKVALRSFTRIRQFVKFMMKEGYFNKGSVDKLASLVSRPLNKSEYETCKYEVIPEEVSSKFIYEIDATESFKDAKTSNFSAEVKHRLKHLSAFLNNDIYELITHFLHRHNSQYQTQLTFRLVVYIEVLHEAFNSNNTDTLIQNLTYVRADICQRHPFSTSGVTFTRIRMLAKYMIKVGYFKEGSVDELTALLSSISKSQYETCKSDFIPEEVSTKFSHEPCADEIFKDTLKSCCTTEIANRLEEHVNTFKHKKAHRAPLIHFLKQISASNPEWHKHPRIIQGELLKFRGNLLDKLQRNSSYGQFQNVKNSLLVLSRQGLLPQNLELPDNLRRCTNTMKVRKDNPLICDV